MNKNYKSLKIKAVQLRKQGLSYNEIKKETDVSKSTLSFWLKNIPLKKEYKERLYTKQIQILSRGPQSQKERREREIIKIISKARKEIRLPLSREVYRFMGVALYWAEGRKTKDFEITNSDPYFVVFMVKWFKNILGISSSRLKARLNIYSQQNDQELKQFWSQLTGIPLENFGKSFLKPPNKGYKKNNLYYGTIKIRVAKGTDLRHRVYGWIQAALQDIKPHLELTLKEWKSLRETPRPVNLLKKD